LAAILEKRNEHLEADHAKEMTRLTETHRAEYRVWSLVTRRRYRICKRNIAKKYREFRRKNAKSTAHDGLEEIEVKILQFLSLTGHTRNQYEIAAHLKVSPEKATYYANKLADEDYLTVSAILRAGGGNLTFSLAQKGRGALIERGLL